TLLAGIRPLLVSSMRNDPAQKIYFSDSAFVAVQGRGAAAEVTDGAVYLGISLRNAGSGIAVLDGWKMITGEIRVRDHLPVEDFVRLTRDLYIAPGDLGYWQGSFRNPSSPEFAEARRVIEARESFAIEIMYGDEEGGQRRISRFGVIPWGEEGG